MTKFLNISTDNTLGGNSPSDVTVSSQKAIKEYVDSHGGSASADGITINTNSSDELQAIGLINKNPASGATNPKYDWVGTLQEHETQSVATAHPDWICYITDDAITSSNGRCIGEIVTSTIPLEDAGLHLLDGSLIANGAYAGFVDYISGLVTDYPDLFCSEADWQSSVTTYGVCGKFVYDSVNNTVRLPKITGFTEGTTDVTALGDLIEAGLPNITGNFSTGCNFATEVGDGAFNLTKVSSNNRGGSGNNDFLFSFDASRSSSIYGNSTTVQPQAIKVLYYIVIATYVKTDIEVDIDEVMTDLNGKADIADVWTPSTSTQAQKEMIIGWSIPDYSTAISLSGSRFTATYKCWIVGYSNISGGGEQILYVNGVEVAREAGDYADLQIPLDVGDVLTKNAGNFGSLSVVAMKGINNA